jgi:hypothetical protein
MLSRVYCFVEQFCGRRLGWLVFSTPVEGAGPKGLSVSADHEMAASSASCTGWCRGADPAWGRPDLESVFKFLEKRKI